MTLRRLRLLVVAMLASVFALAGCAPAQPIEVTPATTIVDVRTPSEYASGHLEGSVNVDLQSGQFAEEIAAYPREAAYVVYCRSGNRSAQAVEVMAELGFENVTDAGGVDDAASATGLPIVTG